MKILIFFIRQGGDCLHLPTLGLMAITYFRCFLEMYFDLN
jgi:hypothetical protein